MRNKVRKINKTKYYLRDTWMEIREKKRLKWIGNELIMMERDGI